MKSVNDNYNIKHTDTLKSLFGPLDGRNGRDHHSLKGNRVYATFLAFFRKLRKIGEANHVPVGEIVLMVSLGLRYDFDEIPFGEFEETEQFIRENIKDHYKIIDPNLHVYLLQCGYYEKSSTAIANPHLKSGYCQTVITMMKNKVGSDKIRQFGIEMSKRL